MKISTSHHENVNQSTRKFLLLSRKFCPANKYLDLLSWKSWQLIMRISTYCLENLINLDIIDKTYEERNIFNNWEDESSWISKSLCVLSNDAEGGNRVCGVLFEVKIMLILSFYSKCIFASAYKFTTIYQRFYAIIQKIAFFEICCCSNFFQYLTCFGLLAIILDFMNRRMKFYRLTLLLYQLSRMCYPLSLRL